MMIYVLRKFKQVLKKYLPAPVLAIIKETRLRYRNIGYRANILFASAKTRDNQKSQYLAQILSLPLKTEASPAYVPLSSEAVEYPNNPKLIAFYLTQFAPCEENDAWWGKGFTEWTNVTKSVPQYVGHYQPQLPIDLGFYDLRVPEVMLRQIELAKQYGIYGFCFYYYWFSGKRILEKPLFKFLENANMDMPFCLCWANEPWSRRWDGSENDLLIGQNLQDEDDGKIIDETAKFFKDARYITIDGCPIFIIYRPHYWSQERVKRLVSNMRTQIKRYGFKDLYLVCALTHSFEGNPVEWGFDAALEFPPHACLDGKEIKDKLMINPEFRGTIRDMENIVDTACFNDDLNYTVFRTVFPAWDNTPRKIAEATIFENSSPELYKRWLIKALLHTHMDNPQNEQFVFINAWNEWAEGAHLEPDRRYGYAYLQATRDALLDYRKLSS